MTFDLSSLETDFGTAPLETPTLLTDFPEIIDNTAREQFFNCPRKFQLSSVNQLTPVRKSIHLHAGGAYAAGLEALRLAYYRDGASPDEALARGVEALITFYGSYEPLEGDRKTCARMVGALVAYVEQYPLASDTLRPYKSPLGQPAVEFTFAIPLDILHPQTGNPILYAGRFDMLAERDGTLFVEDDKTTSQLGPTWGNQWELNSQFTGYVWAASSYGYPVAGAIIRGISILAASYGHAQAIIYRPQWQLERWHMQLLHDVRRMISCWETSYFDLALGGACSHYSGCEFRRLCQSRDPARLIEGNYTRRVWNPTEKDPEAPKEPANG